MHDESTIEKDLEIIRLLHRAQEHDTAAEHDLIVYIMNTHMKRRIGKYLHKNRQAEDDDIKQEFLIGVALGIRNARFDIGDPIEYLINQGIYRVRSYMRKQIISNTIQVCNECGHRTRLNKIGTDYVCKRCGSNNITTSELNEHNEIILDLMPADIEIDENVISSMLLENFEQTLNRNTNVYKLYQLLVSGIDRDNPQIKNYIKEIARLWGGCSEQNVVQNMDKLKKKMQQFAYDNEMSIELCSFVDIK